MKCDCGGSTVVVDVRERIDSVGAVYVRRRLQCKECGSRFSTIEADADFINKLMKINRLLTEI